MSERTVRFVHALIERFPSLQSALQEHIADNFGEVLPHVFFGDICNHVLRLVATRGDAAARRELHDILSHLEGTYAAGNEELQELIAVSFLESLPRPGHEGSQIRNMLGPTLSRQLRIIG